MFLYIILPLSGYKQATGIMKQPRISAYYCKE